MTEYRLPMLPPANQFIQVVPPQYNSPPRGPRPPRPPRPDAELGYKFTAFRPGYYTAIGLIYGRLVAFKRLHNGELGGVYETDYINPSGRREVAGYLWCIGDRDGKPRELKRLYNRYA